MLDSTAGTWPLMVASYNIHRCIGADGRCLPERVAEVIEALDCDVIGLQEVDTHRPVNGRSQIEFLAEVLGMNFIEAPNLHNDRGSMGNAVLSRLPIRNHRRANLSVRNYEPRGLLDTDIETESGWMLRFVVTHLGLRASERRLQVRHILHHLDEHDDATPLALLGDFNEWRFARGTMRALNRRFGRAQTPRTFPSKLPMLPLDRIWVAGGAKLQSLEVYSSPLTRIASDHLPIRGGLIAVAQATAHQAAPS